MKVCLACGNRMGGRNWDCPRCGHSPEEHHGYLTFAPQLAAATDGFDARFFAELAKVEAGNFWFESRNRLLIWALRQYFANIKSFLEIGCGTGFVLSKIKKEIPELTVSGSDIFPEALSYAEKRIVGVTLYQMDARSVPFEEEFDAIGAFDVLEHIEEDEAVLREMFRATRRGGGIILTVPQHPFLWSKMDEISQHCRRYARRELIGKVQRAGFEVVHKTSFVSLLMPLMMLSRIVIHKSADNFDPMTGLKTCQPLNVLLGKVMDLEQNFIKRGHSVPFGGSLLMVAKRH